MIDDRDERVKLSRSEKKEIKREKIRKSWEDPYGIDEMTDEELKSQMGKIQRGSSLRVVFGIIFFMLILYLLSRVWDTIFWTPSRWFF